MSRISQQKGFTLHFLQGKRRAILGYARKGAGFTLIEMLVVIAIITIISAITIVNFRKGGESGRLQRSAQQVVLSIRKAQNMALSGVEYAGEVYNYYGVYFNPQSLPYSYYIFVSSNKTYNPGEQIETINLESNIRVDSVSTGSQLDITFTPPHAFVEFNPSVANATIIIKKEGGTCPNDCRYIKINDKGWMSIKKTP